MHELGCAKEIFERLKKVASSNSFKRVKKVRLSVGEASGIDVELLRHSLVEHLFAGSIFEEAELEFMTEKPSLICRGCHGVIEKEQMSGKLILECPYCGGCEIDVSSGDGVKVLSVE